MAKAQYERASKIAEIYKRRADHLNDLYDKQDRLLGMKMISVHLSTKLNFILNHQCSNT